MRIIWLIAILWTTLGTVDAQSRADRMFERGNYLEALKLYQKEMEGAGEKGEVNDRLKARIANCFFHLNDVVRAGQMYKALDVNTLEAEDLLFYAITLQRSGEYDKALEQVDLIEQMGGDPEATQQLRLSCNFAKEVGREKPVYTAHKTNVDFAGFSAGVTYYKGKGIILAAPGTGEDAAKDTRGYKFTRLYNAVFSAGGTGGRLLPFADELVDKYHIGAVTFTRDYNRIYYTKTILKKDGSSILKLMTAEHRNGKWENIEELNINSEDYSCAHPCLYRDSLLFFVSDMPGGYGGKDLYMTSVHGNECGEVQNLGEPINTPEDELFPFIDRTGRLYFSSNGHTGLGGLDVFVSQMGADGGWSEPKNMGRPINSSMDDFGLVFRDEKCTDGYVSSNRGGTGYNDFLFTLKLLPNRTTVPVQEKSVIVPEKEMFVVDYRYAIQVGAFRNPVPRVYFEDFSNVKVYKGYDNLYRYAVGEYPEETIANHELQGVRQKIGDAFVINIDRYVAEKKIQHDVRGDEVSDDELLLIRLKNFEREKRARLQREQALPRQSRRYLEKPRDTEISFMGNGYTVVLMSANRILDMSRFAGIDEVDVYASDGGGYMYCSGFFNTARDAGRYLEQVKRKGFSQARVIGTGTYRDASLPRPSSDDGLKNLLSRQNL